MPKRGYSVAWVFLLILAILSGLFWSSTPIPVLAASATFKPVADAYVDSTVPGSNYGVNSTLRVDGSPVVRAYLRFNLTGLNGTISLAKLRIYANSASSAGISVRPVSSTSWSETGLTYSNAPAAGSILATTGAVGAASWKEFDITSLVRGNGLISLALTTTGSTAISLASRESGVNSPQLLVTYSSTTSTNTRSPTAPPRFQPPPSQKLQPQPPR